VVTNPTHFTVALIYDEKANGAPLVVAKGQDDFARRLREEAEEHGIPRVEDPPLARWMFTFCEVGQVIPAEIYTAVARVLAFVYSLPPSMRAGTIRPMESVVPVDPGAEAGSVFARRYRRDEATRARAMEVA
jgi:flagellar biosynthetic protein FlhB